jgi:hypothetical protein
VSCGGGWGLYAGGSLGKRESNTRNLKVNQKVFAIDPSKH